MGLREVQAFLQQPDDVENVRLTPAGRRYVKFSGPRGGEGPLTVGQGVTLTWVNDPEQYNRMTESVLDVPPGATLDDIEAAFGVLMARHESLRTTYPDGEPVQRVARSGELAIEVYEVEGQPPDTPVLAVALARRLRGTGFDVTRELPLRVAVATRDGAVLTAAVLYSHLAADFVSMALIGGEFSRLAADPARRVTGPLGYQPLDLAADEQSARGQRRAEAALRRMTEQLRRVPQCMYAVPLAPAGPAGSLSGWLCSPAAALALPHIEARTGTSRRPAVLAALSAVLARRTGHEHATFSALMDNRHEPRMAGYVGSVVRDGIVSVDVRAAGFDELVWRAAMAVLRAGRNGRVDPAAMSRAAQEIEWERGVGYSRDCVYNDISGSYAAEALAPPGSGDPAAAQRALGRSEIWWAEPPAMYEQLLFMIVQVHDELIVGALTENARRVPRADLELLLRGAERLLVAAAGGDVSLGRVGEITGVEPVLRGPGWLRVDSCWIELAEVQRLLDDALPGSGARVFAAPDADGEPALVAYLAAAGGFRTPEQAHLACMALVPSHLKPEPPGGLRYTAITPGRYVTCDRAPDDPSDLAAWQRQPVRAHGTGRPARPPAREERDDGA
jgi:Condensation domain